MPQLFMVLFSLFVLASADASVAHSLGIDRAELVETVPGTYRLVSKVPPNLESAIRSPDLPPHCTPIGALGGERGNYSVTFQFSCNPGLTAEDTIFLPWQREGVLLSVTWHEQEPVTRLAGRDGATIAVPLAEWLAGSGSFWRAASRYTELGFEHILEGVDHLLFVLALLLIVDGWWKLVKTITAFTVAHSITLALATLGFVALPAGPVEATIALSIVFLAAEILKRREGHPSLTFDKPWLVAFAFGLLHGFGFAGALSEIELPPREVPVAMLFFNVGVEAGQLLFVGGAVALLWALKHLRMPRNRNVLVRNCAAYAIGTIAMYWVIERSVGIVASA